MEDTLREINRGVWTISYTGQSPERLQAHMRGVCMCLTSRRCAPGRQGCEDGLCAGRRLPFGLPWPCFGTAAIKHPGSPNLYQTDRHVMDGGRRYRANFGVERDGVNLLAKRWFRIPKVPSLRRPVIALTMSCARSWAD